MPTNRWILTVDLKDVWKNDDLDFPEQVKQIVHRIKVSGWRGLTYSAERFDMMVAELGRSESFADFNFTWEAVYDLADQDRIWIATF